MQHPHARREVKARGARLTFVVLFRAEEDGRDVERVDEIAPVAHPERGSVKVNEAPLRAGSVQQTRAEKEGGDADLVVVGAEGPRIGIDRVQPALLAEFGARERDTCPCCVDMQPDGRMFFHYW